MTAPPRKLGNYVLVRKIATGGMAEVHLARTRSAQGADKYVAIKMIHSRYLEDASFHQMLVDEARLAVQLNHKNIGQVFDLQQLDGRYFLVMEYIDGHDLSRMMDACRTRGLAIPIDVAAFVAREVCSALAYAHTRRSRDGRPLNLIHRDISPQNILLSFDGECKLIDFGIAKVATSMQQTQVGVIKGKFYYMSPEQAGAHQVDQRSDIFSLGICLWEALVGRSLFKREGGPTNPLAILHEIRMMPIPRVREFRADAPRDLEELVARALSRDLTARFQSAAEMQTAFNRFMMNHVPSFSRDRLKGFMREAFEHQEVIRETDKVSTAMAQLMTRGELEPSQHSMIFDLRPATPPRGSGPGDGSAVEQQSRPTNPELQAPSTAEIQVSETVFLKAEAAAAAPPPVAAADFDPNKATQMLPRSEIVAASRAYTAAREAAEPAPVRREAFAEDDPNALTPTPLPPLSRHPLFRALILALLVFCILTATLVLLSFRRAARVEAVRRRGSAPKAMRCAPSAVTARTVLWGRSDPGVPARPEPGPAFRHLGAVRS